jgi:hypothetical protein
VLLVNRRLSHCAPRCDGRIGQPLFGLPDVLKRGRALLLGGLLLLDRLGEFLLARLACLDDRREALEQADADDQRRDQDRPEGDRERCEAGDGGTERCDQRDKCPAERDDRPDQRVERDHDPARDGGQSGQRRAEADDRADDRADRPCQQAELRERLRQRRDAARDEPAQCLAER